MSAQEGGSKGKRNKRRTTALKKQQQVENVVVESTFTLSSRQNNHGEVGDGVYVSATTAGKRYYGVLIDQPALKEATSLWLQDQADSLELNKRIRFLQQNQAVKDARAGATLEDNDAVEVSVLHPNGSTSPQITNEEMISIEPDADMNQTAMGDASKKFNGDHLQTATTAVGAGDAVLPQHTSLATDLASSADTDPSRKRHLRQSTEYPTSKQIRIEDHDTKAGAAKPLENTIGLPWNNDRAVQKFKYITGEKSDDRGYRVLVATFANVEEAASGDSKLAEDIKRACEEGGNYKPGDSLYYYQYEVLPAVLNSSDSEKASDYDIRPSMGLHTFLQNTHLPPWFPLSNLPTRHGKVLNLLNMKKDNHGNITWDDRLADTVASGDGAACLLAGGTRITMQPRPNKRYQIGVVGGGIAGVACCRELVTRMESAGIDYHITLFEARSRLGGRLWTDSTYYSDEHGTIPIELGASWIHGIDDNPLAVLAREAGVDFVTASEEVQMLGEGTRRIDTKLDEGAGKFFDDLLDLAADDCWSAPETVAKSEYDGGQDPQAVVRWYSSVFAAQTDSSEKNTTSPLEPPKVGAPSHRLSSDRSIDVEMGKALLKHKLRNMSKLSADEHRMLLWNTKNVEYALGANISDLSMKYWDVDERHAFDGDHVLLKQGYSSVIDYMVRSIKSVAGDRFQVILNCPVGQVEYARKSTSSQYGRDRFGRLENLVDLSDSCCVTSQDGSTMKYFDFLVCACPLGVLKESIQNKELNLRKDVLSFQPPLPFSKVDAISNVGFGLLDKVYLTFPTAFWRQDGLFMETDQCLFGNISGVNPHHYMFFDIGRCLGSGEKAPPILMSLVSGREAVSCERFSDDELLAEVMATLRAIFSTERVPQPESFRFTRWGQDRYSLGSYTFLPPGTTDQDFHLLQSPINGNGDSLLLDGSEIMRLFFAGEHTTALHPSMAHGAMLSGMRAAKEVVSTIQMKLDDDKDIDRIIPVALFRYNNPSTELKCSLCNKVGGRIREGSLIAFKRGARQVLVHNNCAEYSPEVEVLDSKWKNVIKAVNRGKLFSCALCGEIGATIGCTSANCFRVFHFSCSEDAGWRFDRDGKVFYCDLHRRQAPDYAPHCDRISMKVYLANSSTAPLVCRLCHSPENHEGLGELLAFQFGRRQTCVHEKCIKYTSICDTAEDEDSRMGHEYKNVFEAIDTSRKCTSCELPGATARCAAADCEIVLHVTCASKGGWNFETRGKQYRCDPHRKRQRRTSGSRENNMDSTSDGGASPQNRRNDITTFFNHNLLAKFGAVPTNPDGRISTPGNLDMRGPLALNDSSLAAEESAEEESDSEESDTRVHELDTEEAMDLPLSSNCECASQSVKVTRVSPSEPWGVTLCVVLIGGRYMLAMLNGENSTPPSSTNCRAIVSIDDKPVGEGDLLNLRSIARTCLRESTELALGIVVQGDEPSKKTVNTS